ncbi:MAG: copper chaperone PCu(A)C [Neisseria sp.]|nr:copper chaperone PCu(A)C [Neisseria sp.]
MKKLLCVAAAAVALSAPAWAQDNALHVSNPYSRITAPTVKMGAAFMEITNHGTQDDVLLSGSTPVAKKVELHHTVIDEHGVMKMRESKDGIALPAGKTVVLQPGGLHIMLIDLKQPLKLNDTYPMTLKFKNAPQQTVTIDVNNGKITDMSTADMDHSMHH